MKTGILILLIMAFSISASAQAKKDTVVKAPVVATAPPPPPDSVKIISTKDLVTFLKALKDGASYSIYSQLTPDNVIAELYGWAIREYNKK